MRILWKKNYRNRPSLPPAAGGPDPRPPRCYSRLYYDFVEFVFNAKCVLLPSNMNKITTVNVLLLPRFYSAYFSL